MPIAVAQTMKALCVVTQCLPIGTNLALLHFLWMLASGQLLPSRGAIFPALQAIGLPVAAIRRAWAAFWGGAWELTTLLQSWEAFVQEQGQWRSHQYEGYYPKAVDLTAFWRPALKGCLTKHYHPAAGKALPAIVLGLIARVGSVNSQRVALLNEVVRADPDDPAEASLKAKVLQRVITTLADDEMPVFDAGFRIRELQAVKLPRYVVRAAKNLTARRNVLPEYKGRGRPPEYGKLVRPLARTYKGKTIPATPSDRTETWTENGITFRAEFWDNLVLSDVKVHPDNPTFNVVAIHDPRYRVPWLLVYPLKLSGAALRGLYQDRWPVEQVPLAAKQMLGAGRQFVFAPESQQRLPELALLVGNMVTYLAATLPATPTGFWDRQPKPTPGRLRRVLARTPFPKSFPLSERIRKKASVVAHLPKGILGHRRQKQATKA